MARHDIAHGQRRYLAVLRAAGRSHIELGVVEAALGLLRRYSSSHHTPRATPPKPGRRASRTPMSTPTRRRAHRANPSGRHRQHRTARTVHMAATTIAWSSTGRSRHMTASEPSSSPTRLGLTAASVAVLGRLDRAAIARCAVS